MGFLETLQPLDQMTADAREGHKSLHGLNEYLWRENGRLWKKAYGKQTWFDVHERDHNITPDDFDHTHR
jgi:hypothetical protein